MRPNTPHAVFTALHMVVTITQPPTYRTLSMALSIASLVITWSRTLNTYHLDSCWQEWCSSFTSDLCQVSRMIVSLSLFSFSCLILGRILCWPTPWPPQCWLHDWSPDDLQLLYPSKCGWFPNVWFSEPDSVAECPWCQPAHEVGSEFLLLGGQGALNLHPRPSDQLPPLAKL